MSPPGAREAADTHSPEVVRTFPHRMIDAWNAGDAEGFAAPFAANADFIAFEGTHLTGRARIAAFHEPLFKTVLSGSRLAGGVKFVRLVTPSVAVMHAVASVTLPGRTAPSPGRESMQLFVAAEHAGEWRLASVMNARRLTLEQQALADAYDTLGAEDQGKVRDLIEALRAAASPRD